MSLAEGYLQMFLILYWNLFCTNAKRMGFNTDQ